MDSTPIIEAIYAFRRSKALFTAVGMGVFDRLEQPAPASVISGHPDAVERLLDTCVAMGLLSKQDGLYRNTPIADEFLRSSSPRTLAGYILYSDAALYPLWGRVAQAVQSGENQWQATFGFDASHLFEHFFRSEETKRSFIAGMHGFGQISSPAVAEAFDLSGFSRVVDLGGATGHLAVAIAERYPGLSAAVFDLPAVVPMAREFTAGRVDVIAGDFFRDPLPPADLYCLGRILHDWSEPKIRLLLARIYEALPRNGALLVAEILLDEDKTGPMGALLQSLNMLVCTEGRERTLGEYTALLQEAGFREIAGRRTGTLLDAVLARKS